MRLMLNFVPMCTRVCWHTHVHSCVHMHAQAHTRVGGVHAHTSAHTCVLAHVRVLGRAHMRACACVCRRVLARAWMRAGVRACVCWRVPPSSARLHPLSLGCSRRRRPLPRLGAPPGIQPSATRQALGRPPRSVFKPLRDANAPSLAAVEESSFSPHAGTAAGWPPPLSIWKGRPQCVER